MARRAEFRAHVRGKQVEPSDFGGGMHGCEAPEPDEAFRTGLPARGTNTDLLDHALQRGDSAFRGTTRLPVDPVSASAAADWAGEGGFVYDIRPIPTWRLDQVLEGRVPRPDGTFGGNPMPGENEGAIPARVEGHRIAVGWTVKLNWRRQLTLVDEQRNPRYGEK